MLKKLVQEINAAIEVDNERAEKAAALLQRDALQAQLHQLKAHNALIKQIPPAMRFGNHGAPHYERHMKPHGM